MNEYKVTVFFKNSGTAMNFCYEHQSDQPVDDIVAWLETVLTSTNPVFKVIGRGQSMVIPTENILFFSIEPLQDWA